MLSIERHPVYDNPAKWGTFGIWERPVFDADAFQKKLDAIAGTSITGHPIARLSWAWDRHCREFNFTKWDFAGNGVEGEWEYKYRVARVPIGNGDTTDICAPRWIIEQRYEPEQYALSWERSRWAEKDVGKRHKCGKSDEELQTEDCDCENVRARAELKPPAPAEGWYQLLWTVAEHEPQKACCARLYAENRRNCWGLYRLPGEKDLRRLQRAISLRDADAHKVDPFAPMSDAALAEVHRAAFAESEEEKEAQEKELADIYRLPPPVKAHKRLKGGKWHDINNGQYRRTAAGLLIPK